MKRIIPLLFLASCATPSPLSEERQYITIEGHKIELVADDEQGNLYMKQKVGKDFIYIPYTFEVDDSEQPNVKDWYTKQVK